MLSRKDLVYVVDAKGRAKTNKLWIHNACPLPFVSEVAFTTIRSRPVAHWQPYLLYLRLLPLLNTTHHAPISSVIV